MQDLLNGPLEDTQMSEDGQFHGASAPADGGIAQDACSTPCQAMDSRTASSTQLLRVFQPRSSSDGERNLLTTACARYGSTLIRA